MRKIPPVSMDQLLDVLARDHAHPRHLRNRLWPMLGQALEDAAKAARLRAFAEHLFGRLHGKRSDAPRVR